MVLVQFYAKNDKDRVVQSTEIFKDIDAALYAIDEIKTIAIGSIIVFESPVAFKIDLVNREITGYEKRKS